MSQSRPKIERREPRHKLAMDTARYEAMKAANIAARTKFVTPEEGQRNPTFRRVYVDTFANTYKAVIHDS
jgi:hypothetical protein